MTESSGGGPIGPTFFAMNVNERTCQRCGADYTAHGSRLECPAWAFVRKESEREEALFKAGKIAGEPVYSWNDNKKNLRAEFDAKFTIMGGGENLDEMNTADQVWEWILENFESKKQ